jgi:hypothetical protein
LQTRRRISENIPSKWKKTRKRKKRKRFDSREDGSDLGLAISQTFEEPVHVEVMLSGRNRRPEGGEGVGDVLAGEAETGAGLEGEDFGRFYTIGGRDGKGRDERRGRGRG